MIYCYRCPVCGKAFQLHRSVKSRGKKTKCPECGMRTERDYPAEQAAVRGTPGNWPMLSDAAGVAPHQVKEAEEKSVRDGVPTHFTEDGRVIFESRQHRKRYLQTIGMFDRSAGYGDPTPVNL